MRDRSDIRCWCVPRMCSAAARWSIVYDEAMLDNYMSAAVQVSRERPILIDKFLEDAYEVDVDALCDDEQVVIARHHGAHRRSGNSFRRQFVCSADLSARAKTLRETIRQYTVQIGPRVERRRPDEHSVCDPGRQSLCARGQSARVPNGAVRQQSDRSAAREDCGES